MTVNMTTRPNIFTADKFAPDRFTDALKERNCNENRRLRQVRASGIPHPV